MKVFNDDKLPEFKGKSFEILKDETGSTNIGFSNGHIMGNNDQYSSLILGKCGDCSKTNWFKANFAKFTYNKVLVAGLGLGLIPQDLVINEKCSKVDVVELDQELVDYANNNNFLDESINTIQGDIFTYNTPEKYDLIIIDTIFDRSEMNDSEYQELVNKFTDNLHEGGVLYVPIIKKWHEKF